MPVPRRSTDVIPGPVASVVEAAEEVEPLRVDVEVQDHHDDEVEQAEQQDAFTDALQGPAQHQPGHGCHETAGHDNAGVVRLWACTQLLFDLC